jgi:hypothetical protein
MTFGAHLGHAAPDNSGHQRAAADSPIPALTCTKVSPHDNLDAPGITTPRCVARGPGRSSSGALMASARQEPRRVSDAHRPGSWRVSAR